MQLTGNGKIHMVATAAARYRASRKLPILTDNNEFVW
jgi:hypothetical protein